MACALALVWTACAGPFSLRSRPLTFVWYGLAKQTSFNDIAYVALEDGVTLATNDGIQLFMSVRPDAYVYVFHQTTTGHLAVLWPTAQRSFNAQLKDGRVQTIPSRGRVYALPLARGTEAIYLIAAKKSIDDAGTLVKELQWLFASAQAIATGIPAEQIRRDSPSGLKWKLDAGDPVPIAIVDGHIPIGTTVQCIGERRLADEHVISTAEGGTYAVRAEQISGDEVVARIVRVHRVVSH